MHWFLKSSKIKPVHKRFRELNINTQLNSNNTASGSEVWINDIWSRKAINTLRTSRHKTDSTVPLPPYLGVPWVPKSRFICTLWPLSAMYCLTPFVFQGHKAQGALPAPTVNNGRTASERTSKRKQSVPHGSGSILISLFLRLYTLGVAWKAGKHNTVLSPVVHSTWQEREEQNQVREPVWEGLGINSCRQGAQNLITSGTNTTLSRPGCIRKQWCRWLFWPDPCKAHWLQLNM